MRKFFIVSILFCTLLKVAEAQTCPISYPKSDRAQIRTEFILISQVIERLHELANQSAEIDFFSRSMKLAQNQEYQALVRIIDSRGSNPEYPYAKKGRKFLDYVVDPTYLGLSGTGLDGLDVSEARGNAFVASRSSVVALRRLWECY
jgi:hypothetical protein